MAIVALCVSVGAAVSQYEMWRRSEQTRLSVLVTPYPDPDDSLAGVFVQVINHSGHEVPIASLTLKAEGTFASDLTATLVALPLSQPPVTVRPRDGLHRWLTREEI